jgi:hypothetical protein
MCIAVNMPRYVMSCQLSVVFAWGERTTAPRRLTLLLHAVLKTHINVLMSMDDVDQLGANIVHDEQVYVKPDPC